MTGAYDHSWYSQLQPKPDLYNVRPCHCIGPQNGEPRCPCMMRNMRQVGGRWVEVIDHGPVRSGQEAAEAFKFSADFMKYEMSR